MTARRTAQVRLIDGTTVTVREPSWCLGEHQQGEALEDLFHEGPSSSLEVTTRRGVVEILEAGIVAYPYAARLGREPFVSVVLDAECTSFDPDGLYALADGLERRARELRALARELTELQHQHEGETR